MGLFDVEIEEPDIGYQNIRSGQSSSEAQIRAALEVLWNLYEPYADTNFCLEFARQPYPRFWEMYLAVQLLNDGKSLRPRSDLSLALRDVGPDLCIIDQGRTIWIEAATPEVGGQDNPDSVPEIVPINEGGGAQLAPRRQVELRISGSLWTKRNVISEYRNEGIVGPDDICVIAISGSNFFAQSSTGGWPLAVSAVYPVGEQFIRLDRETFEVTDVGFHQSEMIERTNADPIPRFAFLHEDFSEISGLIWSRRGIGNFTINLQDFVFVHNHAASQPFPRQWFPWESEFVTDEIDNTVRLTPLSS